MAPRGKITRSNITQLNQLVDYMSSNPLFAVGEFTGPLGAQRLEVEWAHLRQLLAEYGPDKTVDQWKHTWRDLKKKARDEGARVRLAQNTTGNTVSVPQLSERTTKILAIIGPECAVGIAVEQETGVGVAPIDIQAAPEGVVIPHEDANTGPQFQLEEIEIEIEDPIEPHVPSRARRSRGSVLPRRARLTEPPSAVFITAQRETNNILRNIANVLVETRGTDQNNCDQLWKMRRHRRSLSGGIHKLTF